MLFILDYSGTLTIFRDPAQFLRDLRQKYPQAKIVLYTGAEKDAIHQAYPSLLALVDDVWAKPHFIKDRVLDLAPEHLILADDEPFTLGSYQRLFRNSGIKTIECLSPEELRSLVP